MGDLKKELYREDFDSNTRIRFLLGGRELKDEMNLDEVGFTKNARVMVVIAKRMETEEVPESVR